MSYDPYGNPTHIAAGQAATQQCTNPGSTAANGDLRYQSAQQDNGSNEYHFGGRTYDPSKDAFTTPDTADATTGGDPQSIGVDPLTRDTYDYVNGDPLNYSDPSGHNRCNAYAYAAGSCLDTDESLANATLLMGESGLRTDETAQDSLAGPLTKRAKADGQTIAALQALQAAIGGGALHRIGNICSQLSAAQLKNLGGCLNVVLVAAAESSRAGQDLTQQILAGVYSLQTTLLHNADLAFYESANPATEAFTPGGTISFIDDLADGGSACNASRYSHTDAGLGTKLCSDEGGPAESDTIDTLIQLAAVTGGILCGLPAGPDPVGVGAGITCAVSINALSNASIDAQNPAIAAARGGIFGYFAAVLCAPFLVLPDPVVAGLASNSCQDAIQLGTGNLQ
jgi:RHS repeat-associated protein